MSKGQESEKMASVLIQDKVGLLISSRLMRSYRAGQVDLAYIEKGIVHLVEVKSSDFGIQNYQTKQYRRLKNSATLIGHWTGLAIRIQVVKI